MGSNLALPLFKSLKIGVIYDWALERKPVTMMAYHSRIGRLLENLWLSPTDRDASRQAKDRANNRVYGHLGIRD